MDRLAIILAAGVGSRLRPITDIIPKCLVPVNGKPIIINALETLKKNKVKEVVIVVGHMKDVIIDEIGYGFEGMKISYISNDIYDKTNNIYSLWLAVNFLNRDVILMECDIFCDEHLLDDIFDLKNVDGCNVMVSEHKSFMDGCVVEIDDDKLIKRFIPKGKQRGNFSFENKYKTVNIYYLSEIFLSKYFVPTLDWYIKVEGVNSFYERVLEILVYFDQDRIYASVVDGNKWFEIDDHDDLAKAERMFI